MKKIIAASSAIALAALPMAGVFATGATTDDLVVTDTLEITVQDTCTFSTKTAYDPATQTYTEAGSATDTTYSATVANGQIASFTGGSEGSASSHIFGVVCNNNNGWNVTASAPLALSDANVASSHNIVYNGAALPTAGSQKEGVWNAIVTGDLAAAASTEQNPTGIVEASGVKYIKNAGGIIATQSRSTDASTFTVTYGAYVGTETPAGTYTATTSLGDNDDQSGSNGTNANDGGGTIDYILATL